MTIHKQNKYIYFVVNEAKEAKKSVKNLGIINGKGRIYIISIHDQDSKQVNINNY